MSAAGGIDNVNARVRSLTPYQPGKPVEELTRDYGADEFMAVTIVWGHDDRIRSYELLADAFAL